MAGTILSSPFLQFLDNNAEPLDSGTLESYLSGTSTPTPTFTSSTLAVENSNPLTLSSSGRATIYIVPGISYKLILKDSTGATISTQDPVVAIPLSTGNVDITGTAGTTLAAGEVVYLSAGDGGLTAGRWYLADADLTYASSAALMIGFAVNAITSGNSGDIRLLGRVTGLSGLVAGTNYYVSATAGALTSSAPTNARLVGAADSTTSLVAVPNPDDPPMATASVAGLVSTTTQTFAGVKTFNAIPVFATGSTSNSQQATTALLGGTTESVKLGGLLTYDATDRAITGVAVLTDSGWTYSIDAAALAVGNHIRVTVAGTSSGGQNVARQVQVNFGGTGVYVINQQTTNAASGEWRGVANILISGASAQRMCGDGLLASTDIINVPDYVTAAVAISGAITLKTQLNPAHTSETITQTMVVVEVC